MQKHQKGFFQFFEKYPSAERRDYVHQDGKTSIVAVSLFEGEADEGFLALYEADGALHSEQWLDRENLQQLADNSSVGYMESLSLLTERVTEKAGCVIVKN